MWVPGDFESYRELYPATPALELPDGATTARFAEAFTKLSDDALDVVVGAACTEVEVVFVRGYLGNWMPGNLVGPMRALRELGVQARIASNRAGATVEDNAATLVTQLRGDGDVLLCGHSKGGIEALVAAESLGDRVTGVILSQSPRGASGVLESLLERAHDDSIPGPRRRTEEWVQRLGLHTIGAAAGGRQLTAAPMAELCARVDAQSRSFPVWQTASWSSQPTTWLDSFHGRLGEIRPGCAHDGQFFLEDLIWPEIPHVLLPHVDHAQPVMGGFGFDEVRYWKVLIALFRGAA